MTKGLLIAAAAAGLAVAAASLMQASEQPAAASNFYTLQPVLPGDEVAVFAGGCFWGMEGVFEHIKGVKSVTSGYAGGEARDANYGAVSSETTDHAETVRIVYDPKIVSYTDLLSVFFIAAHDPTQVNAQYPDSGPSYRSAIFPQSDMQRLKATAFKTSMDRSGVFGKPIATKLEDGGFYPAEANHQDFMQRNPYHPYILRWDKPRLAKLEQVWPELYAR